MEDAEDSESDSGEAERRWDEEGRIVAVIVVVTLRWDWEEKDTVPLSLTLLDWLLIQ
jgi:hypothetical protein